MSNADEKTNLYNAIKRHKKKTKIESYRGAWVTTWRYFVVVALLCIPRSRINNILPPGKHRKEYSAVNSRYELGSNAHDSDNITISVQDKLANGRSQVTLMDVLMHRKAN